jgi:hypothetical protein
MSSIESLNACLVWMFKYLYFSFLNIVSDPHVQVLTLSMRKSWWIYLFLQEQLMQCSERNQKKKKNIYIYIYIYIYLRVKFFHVTNNSLNNNSKTWKI